MLKITVAVEKFIKQDEVALSSLSQGWLNLSAYAKTIKKNIEDKTKKPVKTGSIVVALSRLEKSLSKQKALLPKVVLQNISAKSGLIDISYNKTPANQKKAATLQEGKRLESSGFYTITQGITEISIIADRSSKKEILEHFRPDRPKYMQEDVAALTVSFAPEYLPIPNIMFSLIRQLALHRIILVEIVSTYTELSFILHERDLQPCFAYLGSLMKSSV